MVYGAEATTKRHQSFILAVLLLMTLGHPASIHNQLYAPLEFEDDEYVRQVEWEKMKYRDMYNRKLPLQSFHIKLYLNYTMTSCSDSQCFVLYSIQILKISSQELNITEMKKTSF